MTSKVLHTKVAGVTYDEKVINRFWSKVAITKNSDDCWEWQGSKARGGYGNFFVGNGVSQKFEKASRVAYRLTYGDFPMQMYVMHKCDNPPCCNPNHLCLGTPLDNARDREAKNRGGNRRTPDNKGEKHGMHKLTLNQVRGIRAKYSEKNITQEQLAKQYNVARSAISFVVNGKRWKDTP